MNIHDLAKRMSEKTAEIYRLKERKKCDAETIASLKKALASREKELTPVGTRVEYCYQKLYISNTVARRAKKLM